MLELELVSNTRRVFEPGTRYAGSVQLCSHRSGHAASWACHEQGTEQTSSIERFNLLHSSSSFSINNTTVRLPSQQRCTGAHLPFFGGTRCTLLISRDGRVVCARQDSKHIVLHISNSFARMEKIKLREWGANARCTIHFSTAAAATTGISVAGVCFGCLAATFGNGAA